MEKRV